MKKVRKILNNLSGLFLFVGIGILIEVLFPNATIYLSIGVVCIFCSFFLLIVFLRISLSLAIILLASYYKLIDKWKERREKNPKNLTIKKVTDLKIAKPI